MSLVELIAHFWEHLEAYYGKDNREVDTHRATLRIVKEFYGDEPASLFGPTKLKTVRQTLIDAGQARGYINQQMSRLKRVFRWGVSEELIKPEVYHKLQAVEGLHRGRSDAKEGRKILPVPMDIVDATLAELKPTPGDMVRVQLLTGARPGEVCSLRPDEIDRTGEVWLATLRDHKNAHRDKTRTIAVGPRAQAILQRYLFGEWCFTTSRGTPYQEGSYRQAIQRAAKRAGVPSWFPLQLRHSRATDVRRQYGLEAAQVTLGHTRADVTQVYAERNLDLAIDVAKKIG